jgi:integrase
VATALRSYLRYRTVCGDSVAGLNAVISSPAQWKLASLPRAFKPDEVQRLLAAIPYGRKPRRGYAIVRCALDMGLRAGEIANLSIDDIDWREGTVTLKGTKSRRQDILPCRRPALATRHISPHVIRHTTAMHLLQAGVDISVIALWLGHESPATTHQYVEADLAMKERALARLHEPEAKLRRYRAPDSLIDFLRTL